MSIMMSTDGLAILAVADACPLTARTRTSRTRWIGGSPLSLSGSRLSYCRVRSTVEASRTWAWSGSLNSSRAALAKEVPATVEFDLNLSQASLIGVERVVVEAV